ncbi:hypothetical protein HMPREF0294_0101 [Corynebacterium glucuronolyticum ATCC 51867]|nr:hypothetical protein HMPREF0294_0101 [Corynebacterium glucuronolyticum ATCC 51867]
MHGSQAHPFIAAGQVQDFAPLFSHLYFREDHFVQTFSLGRWQTVAAQR